MKDSLIIGAADVAARLPMEKCIDAVEEAFRQLGNGTAPPAGMLGMHAQHGAFHIKAGFLSTARRSYFAAKTNGNFPGNPAQHNLPTIQGVVVLCDADNGRVLALIDSAELTARRTAAATGVAARYLAVRDATVATICGAGVQAPAQLEALVAVRPIERVFVFDLNADSARAFAVRMAAELGLRVEVATSLAAAVAESHICVTCTTSRDYILDTDAAHPGLLIAAVGVDNEHKRELSPGLMRAARVVTDVRAQCAIIGDLHHAVDSQTMTVDDVYADLGDLAAGKVPGRTEDDEFFVFDSTGIALQDVAAAAAIFEQYEQN